MNDNPPVDKAAGECRRIIDECRECPATERLISYHEDELPAGDAGLVAAHVGNCLVCARLLEQLTLTEEPVTEDAADCTVRDEDRAEVAKALGFRVGRPPGRPLLERLSWIWESRVPALIPTAVCAMLLMVILWPAPTESPVTDFGRIIWVTSDDAQTRTAPEGPPVYQAPVKATLMIRHSFLRATIEEGTMVSREIIGPRKTVHLDPLSVVTAEENGKAVPCIEFPLYFREPGTYYLRLSHPEEAFALVTLKLEIQP